MQLANTLYEPRAFWSVQRLRNDGLAPRVPSLRLTFPKLHFYNGEKYNVTLRHLVVSAIGYPLEIPDYSLLPASSTTFRNGRGPVLERARLSIAAAGRYYLDQEFHALQVYGEEQPTSEPERLDGSYTGGNASPASTRLFNIFRWDFDEHLYLPKGGTVDLRLGTYGMPASASVITGANPSVRASIAFEESRAGFWPAASRQQTSQPVLTAEGAPYAVPGFGNESNATYLWPGNDAAVISPQAQLNATQFLRQAIGQDSPSELRGFAVAIDQITHDDVGYGGLGPAAQLASVGERLNVRARNVNGGTQADWWRPDAPLSLVSPTMTSARVYRLHTPIMLAPGDNLEVRMELPEPTNLGGEIGTVTTDYQIGVSFCGSAAIQG